MPCPHCTCAECGAARAKARKRSPKAAPIDTDALRRLRSSDLRPAHRGDQPLPAFAVGKKMTPALAERVRRDAYVACLCELCWDALMPCLTRDEGRKRYPWRYEGHPGFPEWKAVQDDIFSGKPWRYEAPEHAPGERAREEALLRAWIDAA